MSFGQLIRRVQGNSDLSYQDSKDSLIMLVEALAARLNDRERRSFARILPDRLQDIALSVYPMSPHYDVIAHFMYYQNIGKYDAGQRIATAWRAISEISNDNTEAQILFSHLAADNSALPKISHILAVQKL